MNGFARIGVTLALALAVSCATDRPLVEGLNQGEWQPVPFQIVSMGGQRAAARVLFILRLEAPSGRQLVVEGNVEINPQATLIDGSWVEHNGSNSLSGVVTSSAIDFFGGQGDRPSLGGQFTLSAAGATVYRIHLPATQLSTER